MLKLFISLALSVISLSCQAQEAQPFKGKFYNEEYQIYLTIDAYEQSLRVPGQEVFGEVPGYLSSKRDSRVWLLTDVTVKNDHSAVIDVINDYGSEDFTALLTLDGEGNITMKHQEGSTYKIVVKNKYVKIPSKIVLKPVK